MKYNIRLLNETRVVNPINNKTIYEKHLLWKRLAIRKFQSKSFLKNFSTMIYYQFAYRDSTNSYFPAWPSLKIENGSTIASQNILGIWDSSGLGLATTHAGIVWGTGTTTPTPIDYALTSIANGTGTGQFLYQSQQGLQVPTVSGSVTTFVITRLGLNNSGASIDVKECGIFVENTSSNGILIVRDVYSAVLTVPNANGIITNYTIQITT